MFHPRLGIIAIIFTTCVAFAGVAAAEQVDNPSYLAWAKHKPGTSVLMTNEMNIPVQKMTMNQQITQTLVSVTPEKATIEMTIQIDMAGQKREVKQSHDVAAKVEKGQEYMPKDTKGTIEEVGNETLTVGGKQFDCKAFEFTGTSAQGASTGKVWRCEDIPGGVAKVEMKITAAQPMEMKMTTTAIDEK